MDHYTVVTSLKRLDKKFTEQLSEADRRAAFSKFKRVYAEQMAKLASEITKRQKVQDNINQASEKEREKAREIDEGLKRKMEKSTMNREKQQESVGKEIKMLDENWKRRMEEIQRKKREESKDAIRKAEKMRREAEEYWVKKKSYTARENPREEREESISPPAKPEHSFLNVPSNHHLHAPSGHYMPSGMSKKQPSSINNKTFNQVKSQQKQLKFLLPDLKKVKLNTKINQTTILNDSISEQTKNDDIRVHLTRTERNRKDEEDAKFQKAMQKLQKIEKTRLIAQEKLEQEVKEAKRMRELRESPEVHAANRQRSIEQLHSKSKQKLQKSLHSNSKELHQSLSKSRLSRSIEKHLQTKKRIQEEEFNERESVYQLKKQKLRHGKMNRLIKEAINQIKQKTLNQKQAANA